MLTELQEDHWKVPVVSRGYERPQRLSERQSRGEAEGTTEFFGCQDSKRAVGKDKEKMNKG